MQRSLKALLSVCMWIGFVFLVRSQLPVESSAARQAATPSVLTMTLRARSVQEHLGLDRDQISRLQSELIKVETPLWRLRDLPEAEQSEKAGPLLREFSEATSRILLPHQRDRLHELILQAQGIRAVAMPSVAGRLRLTTAQRAGIGDILRDLDRQLAETGGRNPAALDAARGDELRAEAERQIFDLLGAGQRRVLNRMVGPPFDFATIRHIACKAPDVRGIEAWINSEPLTLGQLEGKVVALHFYTFGCINCIRNLPHYNAWYKGFPKDRFVVLGIHTPETKGEHDIARVRRKAEEAEMQYPLAVDNKEETWKAWANHVWPAVYLIDKEGFVRYWWYGELNWQQIEGEKWMRRRIRELLAEDVRRRP